MSIKDSFLAISFSLSKINYTKKCYRLQKYDFSTKLPNNLWEKLLMRAIF